jgi:hypothetical protein
MGDASQKLPKGRAGFRQSAIVPQSVSTREWAYCFTSHSQNFEQENILLTFPVTLFHQMCTLKAMVKRPEKVGIGIGVHDSL